MFLEMAAEIKSHRNTNRNPTEIGAVSYALASPRERGVADERGTYPVSRSWQVLIGVLRKFGKSRVKSLLIQLECGTALFKCLKRLINIRHKRLKYGGKIHPLANPGHLITRSATLSHCSAVELFTTAILMHPTRAVSPPYKTSRPYRWL
jgi:hypothetical protein